MMTFIPLNYLFLRFQVFKSVDPKRNSTLGTVYFVISCTLLCLTFHSGWERGFPRGNAYIGTCGIMGMAFGDSLANYIGRTFGRRYYRVYGNSVRTVEGSLAAFVAIFVAVYYTLELLTVNRFNSKISGALVSASIGTLAEAVAPFGIDNLTVPLSISYCIWYLGY
ncbi:hypothetical protein K493DRAFT_316539 [Basidiobolus meristosporus CBS 931.73]|uniref:Uncharacterized protein n=1 Tax=Basidiobolus meristosporus CBS 931.73 TaxID=1314790 RepID=A0A1Y1Y3H0_9FUNG|nr:hypothetical protein K493DRAFT_316539 [Basidiobolus meristosporus CBS 931.73]|eukprot:ORX92538.1 hypothetical protein K493DRAFT_316539 [Basidiobolus meristosporus CBS 931.73]